MMMQRGMHEHLGKNKPGEHEPLLLQISCQGLLAHLKLLLEATKDIERCEKKDKKVVMKVQPAKM